MKIKYSFIILIFITNLFTASNIASAKQSDEFINYLANGIYNDCDGEGLIIKEDSLKLRMTQIIQRQLR